MLIPRSPQIFFRCGSQISKGRGLVIGLGVFGVYVLGFRAQGAGLRDEGSNFRIFDTWLTGGSQMNLQNPQLKS